MPHIKSSFAGVKPARPNSKPVADKRSIEKLRRLEKDKRSQTKIRKPNLG
jgi:hypothetical protein